MTDQLLAVGAAPPDRPALIFPEGTLSYGQLERAASAIAADLREGSRVAVWAASALETCVAMVAVLAAGAVAVPLNPRSGTRELAHMLSDSGPERVLVPPGAETPGELSEFGVRPVRLDVDAERVPAREVSPDAPGLIVYTSGTTGPPKGAVLSRRALAANLDALAAAWEWTRDDVLVHALPLFHAHGLVLGHARARCAAAARCRHLGRFSPEAVAGGLPRRRTMLFGVPTMYHRLAEAAEDDARRGQGARRAARLLVSGSAALPAGDHDAHPELTGQRVVRALRADRDADEHRRAATAEGPRRATSARRCRAWRCGWSTTPAQAIDGLGRRDHRRDGGARARTCSSSYLNRPEATAAALPRRLVPHRRPGHTRAATGSIRIVGRKATDLIKTGGYKVGAGEIEAALLEHPAVERGGGHRRARRRPGRAHRGLGRAARRGQPADGARS